MKKRIFFSVLWALAFGLTYWALSCLALGILGLLLGPFPKETSPGKLPSYMWVFGVWAWLFWLSPIIGLALVVWGVLPGTRPKKEPKPAI